MQRAARYGGRGGLGGRPLRPGGRIELPFCSCWPVVSLQNHAWRQNTMPAEEGLLECLSRGAGEVAEPSSEAWNKALRLQNSWFNADSLSAPPAGVVLPSSAQEVSHAIKCCNKYGSRVTARCGSHGNAGAQHGTLAPAAPAAASCCCRPHGSVPLVRPPLPATCLACTAAPSPVLTHPASFHGRRVLTAPPVPPAPALPCATNAQAWR